MSDELKPCAHCGERAMTYVTDNGAWRVCCYHCGTESGQWTSKPQAVAAWNRRAGETG